MIRAITVDCWGTLLLDGPSGDERYARQRLAGIESILAASGVPVSRHDLDRAYVAWARRLARIWADGRDVPLSRYVGMLLETMDPGLPRRLETGRLDQMIEAYSKPALLVPPALDPGAVAAFGALAARGIALGVVSNTMRTPGVVLRRIFDDAGLLGLFEVLVFSDECGIRKPDPEIFRLALRRLGASPQEALHVGDDPRLDVEGARQAGMGAIQVAGGSRATGPVKADVVIHGLDELPEAVGRFGA
jgi:putative hydrolase of the HAD superfamily